MASSYPADTRHPPSTATRVVGLGASAGGLEPLEQFLSHVPARSGLAYIVVQHLDPTRKAMLAELLQRVTKMPVYEAGNGMRVGPNCVYVIPENVELSLAGELLCLKQPDQPRGQRLPIDVLFSSLAGNQGERAIAVVLSGMGTDGTLGMQAIKAVGGLTVVQQPESAQFDSMPKSAIAAGCGDLVALPAELPARILDYIAQVPDPVVATDKDLQPAFEAGSLDDIFVLLLERTQHDFSHYKPRTLRRRIERRMVIHSMDTVADYADFLRRNAHEIDLLFNELLIGVTSFFRDPPVWTHLHDVVLPELLERRAEEHALRAWVIGCSTGEEAYSLAMVFSETVQRLKQFSGHTLQIFASDLSSDAVSTARRGRYPPSISENVSPYRLAHFFSQHDTYVQINSNIRDMVLFAHHDVILDPPFTKLDLIVCRNLLIYFDTALQRKLFPLFHYSLRPGGVLVLGTAETPGKFSNLFAPIDSKLRIYLRQDDVFLDRPDLFVKSYPPLYADKKELTMSTPTKKTHADDGLQAAADRVLLQAYSPPAVVVSSAGDIVYISGRTGNFLEPAAGKANLNFHTMVRDGLRAPITVALKQAAQQREPIQLHGLQVKLPGGVHMVDVTVQALDEPKPLEGMMLIVFREIAPLPSGSRRRTGMSSLPAATADTLQDYLNEIQSLRDESRASKEELQSANEELQSTNEELQSTNEELMTSKEEMQSMNEELQTINAELQSKLDDLAIAQSDLQNLLNSVDIAILFLDQDMNVRRYTEQASNIINLRESDIGRPLSDLTTSLQYPNLHKDALRTLRTLEVSEKQAMTKDNTWYSVRIIPYRRLDNVIDGVAITLVDITSTKALEASLRQEIDPSGEH